MDTAERKSTGPLNPDLGVMAFVPDFWGEDVWQVRHQVLTRLSRYYRVLWVDPAIRWRDAVGNSPRRPVFDTPLADAYPNFDTYRHSKWSARIFRPSPLNKFTRRNRVKAGIDHLRRRGCKEVVAYLWRPQYSENLDTRQFVGYCYHIDDEYSFSTVELPVDKHEQIVIQGANQVFIHSPGMMEKKGQLNSNTTYIPNGVDVELYTRGHDKPAELQEIHNPVVMYIGVLKSMLDWDLLQELSIRLPDVSFVFVGPRGTLTESDDQIMVAMSKAKNVHFVGSREIDELPAYAAHASICIMPYRSNGYTKFIFPIKVNEYLAAGKPAIGTPIRTLRDFSDQITLATDADQWVAAIRDYLGRKENDNDVCGRVEFAKKFEWDDIVRSIAVRIGANR